MTSACRFFITVVRPPQVLDHFNLNIWELTTYGRYLSYGARDWWPCKDDPSDKADSLDIVIIVPDNQTAVSNGVLVEEIELGDGRKNITGLSVTQFALI